MIWGTAGLIRFTNDPTTITKYPELATSVFYHLRAALQNPILPPLSTTPKQVQPPQAVEEYRAVV